MNNVAVRYVMGYDKWYRMLAGIASDLEKYEEGVLHLRIGNTGKRFPSNMDTARKFAVSWKRHNPELGDAKAFSVIFNGEEGAIFNDKF